MAKRNRNTNAGKVNTGRTRVNVQAAESKTFTADGNPETSTDDIASAPQHRSADDEHGTRSDDERLSARSTEVATVNEGGSRSNPGSIRQEQDNTATSDSEGGLSRKPGFFRSGSERSSEFAARIARQRLDRSSTYHAPTQASIAKGRGKVQLPSGRSSRENLKGPPQQIVAPQGSASNLGDGRRWRQPGSEEEDFGDNTSNTDARNWSGSSTPDSYGSSGNDEAETTTQNPPSDLSSAQIRALERKLSKIEHELEEKREDLRDANEYMEKLRQETEKLTTIISRAYSGDQNSSPDFAALKSLLQASEFDTESSAVKSALLQVTLRFENTIQSLSSDKERIQQQLTDSESKLDIVLKSFEKKAQFAATSVPGAQSAWENDRDSFEGIYRDERRKRVYAEEQLKKLRETVEQWRQPDHANEELKANLDNTHAEIVKLQETLEKQQALAELWESECKTKQDELEKCTTGFENEASHQRTDMLTNIQDYYDKVCDQEHWHPEGLQETIRKLEREKQVTIEDFETLKSEKRRTKEEISKLRKTLAPRGKNRAIRKSLHHGRTCTYSASVRFRLTYLVHSPLITFHKSHSRHSQESSRTRPCHTAMPSPARD
jgi:hypothetical protein